LLGARAVHRSVDDRRHAVRELSASSLSVASRIVPLTERENGKVPVQLRASRRAVHGMIKSMRSAGSLLAIIAVLIVISALFAQLMARLTGLQLPVAATSLALAPASAVAASVASSAARGAVGDAGRSSAGTAPDASDPAGNIASNSARRAENSRGASPQTLATAPAPAASNRSPPVGALLDAATHAAATSADPASSAARAGRSAAAGTAAAPAASAPAMTSADSYSAPQEPMTKAATHAAEPISARNSAPPAARRLEVAVAPTPEQLRPTQCRTLQGYEAELAAQIAAGADGADTPSLSGLRQQLAITRARWLELDC
jgi:hypothetical protein